MRVGYTAISSQGEKIEFFAHSTERANRLGTLDAMNYIINNFDMSQKWDYRPNGKFKFPNDNRQIFTNQPI